MRTYNTYLTLMLFGAVLVAGCEQETPPRSVMEFLDNPIMLEAAMVRCSENRSATRYDAECVNARQASSQIAAKEEAARGAEREARSERKRQALRRTQEAAAQARRRATEAEQRRKEAEYLAQFGVAPPSATESSEDAAETGNSAGAVLPESNQQETYSGGRSETLPATDGGNAGGVTQAEADPATDLESIRDELQRRNEDSGN